VLHHGQGVVLQDTTELFSRGKVSGVDLVNPGSQKGGGALQQAAEWFLFALDVAVEAGLLHPESMYQILHGGVVVALFFEETGSDLEELVFPRRFSLGH